MTTARAESRVRPASRSLVERAASAHVLTDEAFALTLPHFRRLGRFDGVGYWIAAGFVVVPWILATAIGFVGGQLLPDPRADTIVS